MALKNPSLFLYNFQITASNCYISFGTSVLETGVNARLAQIPIGYYSLTSLMTAIAAALTSADPLHTYSLTANRSIAGGLQNRVTIATSGTYLSIYFGTGNISNPASLIGFASSDLTGALSYTGTSTCGTVLVPEQLGYSYLDPNSMKKNFGALNVASSGKKESIVFALQQFVQVQFKQISATNLPAWSTLRDWMIQQREFEFTPDITAPNTFYSVTLDDPNQGLQCDLTEMLGQKMPFYYQTPLMKFRVAS